ncbi:MAG: hypothetical protein IJS04_02335 [Muribaculaceae bacterium]|nr:hypothetical protein [Muribaculaceae bacterium]
MRVFSIICAVIIIAVPTISTIYVVAKGYKATETRAQFVSLSLVPGIVMWLVAMVLLWGAGVFKNFS